MAISEDTIALVAAQLTSATIASHAARGETVGAGQTNLADGVYELFTTIAEKLRKDAAHKFVAV